MVTKSEIVRLHLPIVKFRSQTVGIDFYKRRFRGSFIHKVFYNVNGFLKIDLMNKFIANTVSKTLETKFCELNLSYLFIHVIRIDRMSFFIFWKYWTINSKTRIIGSNIRLIIIKMSTPLKCFYKFKLR